MAANLTEVSGAERQRELLDIAGRVLAGGGLGLFNLPDEVNLVVAEGKGSHVVDVAGREYIDYHLGSGPDLLGHAHPAITEAVGAQLAKGTTYYYLNQHAIRLAERVVEAVPCGEQLHFTGSGTEATFFALRVARAHTERMKVMKFEGAWHGMHDYALWGTVPTEASDYPHARPDSAGIPPETGDEVLVAPFNDAERAVALIDRYASELAAVIVEPLQRVLVPRPGFLEAVREVDPPPRHRADLRRDRHRLPDRLGRRPGALRRRARRRDLRQGDGRGASRWRASSGGPR